MSAKLKSNHDRLLAITEKQRARFWSKVDSSGGAGACWEWRGGRDEGGYGKVQFGPKGDQGHFRAHRVALFLTIGGDGEVAMHSCDHPPCCNPRHLSWAMTSDNVADRSRKGRSATGDRSGHRTHPESTVRGDRHPNTKVTDAQAAEIRARYAIRRGVGALAREFGVSRSTLHRIATGRARDAS